MHATLKPFAGVSWFTRLAAAMGEDPGAVYQQCITSLGQQEGLRPPYNHASRQEVGLKQQWSVQEPFLHQHKRQHSSCCCDLSIQHCLVCLSGTQLQPGCMHARKRLLQMLSMQFLKLCNAIWQQAPLAGVCKFLLPLPIAKLSTLEAHALPLGNLDSGNNYAFWLLSRLGSCLDLAPV